MHIKSAKIPDVKIITPQKHCDNRGFFMESFRQDVFENAIGRAVSFKQSNHSCSRDAYTIRGLHFQSPPHAQEKLVRCTRGEILDVVVDIRIGSPTYGQYVTTKLSAENAQQVFVPTGFLHGVLTLTKNAEVQYKCSNYYMQKYNSFVLWNDKTLAIDWGDHSQEITISSQDQKAFPFKDFNSPFKFKSNY